MKRSLLGNALLLIMTASQSDVRHLRVVHFLKLPIAFEQALRGALAATFFAQKRLEKLDGRLGYPLRALILLLSLAEMNVSVSISLFILGTKHRVCC